MEREVRPMVTAQKVTTQYRPSFGEGFARSFDLFGQRSGCRYGDSSPEAIIDALSRDWAVIASDMRVVMLRFESEHHIEVLHELEAANVAGDRKGT